MTGIEVTPAVVTINGKQYHANPCTIESTMLGYEDHGIASGTVFVKGDHWGVGLGGYCLDTYDRTVKERVPTVAMGLWVAAVLHCVGVRSWEALKGKQVHALFDTRYSLGSTGKGIASADLSRALVFDDLFASVNDTVPA